jgi:hypothetical protein
MMGLAKLMIGYGVVLIVCGLLGWASAGFAAKAKTAILSGAISGLVMIGCGWLSSLAPGAARTLGRTLGPILPVLFAGVFTWRAAIVWRAWAAGEPKLLVALVISIMALASLVAFVLLMKLRLGKPSL